MVRRFSRLATRDSSDSSTKPTRFEDCLDLGEVDKAGCRQQAISHHQPFGQSGQLLSRATVSSKLLRKWQTCHWVHLQPASLVVFRSRLDFQRWASEGDDYVSRRRDPKVILFVDFDTLGMLAAHTKLQRGLNSNSLLANSKASSLKIISKLQKYALGDVKATLTGNTHLLTFALERFSNIGVDTVASFASHDAEELRSLRKVIHECIQITSRSKPKVMMRRSDDDDTHDSTVARSQITSSGHDPMVRRYAPVALR